MGIFDFLGGGEQAPQVQSATNLKIPKDPGGLYHAPVANFDPNAQNYPGMPRGITTPAYIDGMQQSLMAALSKGFGGAPGSYASPLFQPQTYTQLSEPLSITMRAMGTEMKGPGVVGPINEAGKKVKKTKPGETPIQRGFNPMGYNQWGQSSGSPFLDYAFGLQSREGIPGQGGTPAPVDPKKKQKVVY